MKNFGLILLGAVLGGTVTFFAVSYGWIGGIHTAQHPMTSLEGTGNSALQGLPLSLLGSERVWVKTLYNDGKEILPKQPSAFVLNLDAQGQYAASTDCNTLHGSFSTAADNGIKFGPGAMTKKYCEGTQELEFRDMLERVESYMPDANGNLVLVFKADSGTMTFQKKKQNNISLHPSRDKDYDGINDCEKDDTCDHHTDYSQPKPSSATETITLIVAPEKRDCDAGVMKTQCLLVKPSHTQKDRDYFYDTIEGFTWQEGYLYEIQVHQESIANPPADGSSLKYTLKSIVSKKYVLE